MSDLVGNPNCWFSHAKAQFTNKPCHCLKYTSNPASMVHNKVNTASHMLVMSEFLCMDIGSKAELYFCQIHPKDRFYSNRAYVYKEDNTVSCFVLV